MPFVQAKCPMCGGMLAVDDSKKTAICQFCGDAFVVEEAVNNYITHNVTYNVTNQNFEEGTVVNVYENQSSVSSLIERAFMFLEEGDFSSANEYCEKVLDLDPKCAEAYLGKLMADLRIKKETDFAICDIDFETNKSYQKIIAFGDEDINQKLKINLARIKADDEIRQQETNKKMDIIQKKRQQCFIASKRIHTSNFLTACTTVDGKVCFVGKTDNLYGAKNWTDIVSFASNYKNILGVKADGTVVTAGYDTYNVSSWKDIVSIYESVSHIVGLKSDGTVVAKGENNYHECDVSGWTDIIAVSVTCHNTYGLKSNGTVVAVGDDGYGQQVMMDWTNIVAISAQGGYVYGLKSDGTVVMSSYSLYSSEISKWKDIIAISAGEWHVVGLKSDGTVVAIGENKYNECDVSGWTDIVAVSAGKNYTVGLKSDGTVVAIGENDKGQCNVQKWKLFKNITELEDEEKLMIEKTLQMSQYCSQGLCRHCGGDFKKGLFSTKCVKCGKPKDY